MNFDELKQLITLHEGIRQRAYLDTKGKRTVGIGFNLDGANAQRVFNTALPSVSYTNVRNGVVALTTEQIQTLLSLTLNLAIDDAKDLVTSFDAQPEQVQLVLTDMSFQLGKPVLSHFVKFLGAIEREDYPAAIAQIVNSAYYHEVGQRAKDNIALLNQLVAPNRFEGSK